MIERTHIIAIAPLKCQPTCGHSREAGHSMIKYLTKPEATKRQVDAESTPCLYVSLSCSYKKMISEKTHTMMLSIYIAYIQLDYKNGN